MKKLLGISMIAALAVLPMAANAAEGDREVTALTAASGGSTTNLATTSYVQGAYTAVKTQFDKMVTDTAVATDGNYIDAGKTVSHNLSELDTQAKANADAIAAWTTGNNSIANQIKSQAEGADFTATSGMTADTIGGAINELDGEVDALQTQMGNTSLSGVTGLTAGNVTDAIVELQGDKQEKSDSNVTSAGNYLTTGYGVGANLEALDTAVGKVGTGTHNTGIAAANSVAANLEALDTAIGTLTSNSNDTYATKTGTLATINASTVPIVTGWGQDATTTTTLNVSAPNAYQAGTPAIDCTDPTNASNPACL